MGVSHSFQRMWNCAQRFHHGETLSFSLLRVSCKKWNFADVALYLMCMKHSWNLHWDWPNTARRSRGKRNEENEVRLNYSRGSSVQNSFARHRTTSFLQSTSRGRLYLTYRREYILHTWHLLVFYLGVQNAASSLSLANCHAVNTQCTCIYAYTLHAYI
jgi:hypothetical protein